jgi:acyl-CoA thioesterase
VTTDEVGVARREFDRDRAARLLGIELVETADGSAVARLAVTEQLLNGQDTVHGGVVFLLADTAFGAACNGREPLSVIASATIEFVRPARAGETLVATATRRLQRHRSGVYDVTVRSEDDIVAEFRGRSWRSTTTATSQPGG